MKFYSNDILPSWYDAYVEGFSVLIRHLDVSSVVEIGVRTGYGAQLFHNLWPYALYQGFDKEQESAGEHEFGRERVWEIDGEYTVLDTQTVDDLGVTADFVHIDAAHTAEGTEHDLELAVKTGARWVFVDDLDNPDVLVGVRNSGLRFDFIPIAGTPRVVGRIAL